MKTSTKGTELKFDATPPVNKILSIKTVGQTPLLMHTPSGQMGKAREEVAKKKQIPTAEEEAKAGLYIDSKGQLYLPTAGFRACLLYASKGRRIGKASAVAIVSGAVQYIDEETLLIDPDTDEPLPVDYEIDTRRAIVQKQGILRSRPRFPKWGAIVKFQYNPDFISPVTIIELLKVGGQTCGVGDFRPSKTGTFGKFIPVKAWEE